MVFKKGDKELDSKYFNANERDLWSEADLKEWKQWIANKVVQLVPRLKEKLIPKQLIISAPMRFVRTNKNKPQDDPSNIDAKSRLVIPGHTDPQLGLYRTDAPTTGAIVVIVCVQIALSKGGSWKHLMSVLPF